MTFLQWLVALLMIVAMAIPLKGQSFDLFLQELADNSQKEDAIIEYISSAGGLPLLEGDTVIFMAKCPLQRPKIMSGFNGFLSPRYITDSTAGDMYQIGESSWYFLKKRLEPDARIFYQIHCGAEPYNDPFNSQLGYRFNLVNSQFSMPEFGIHRELIQDQFVPQGRVESFTYYSNAFRQERNLQVYLPPGYQTGDKKYASAYFHDGSFYVEWGKVPQILDYLIAHGKIEPVIAVFDNPLERGKEYRGDSIYLNYLHTELIPFIDSTYRTRPQPAHRAVIGGSRGGLSSLIVSHSIPSFSKCGTFSPAVHPRDIEEFISFLSGAKYKPSQVVIVGAIYDKIWYPDALALKDYFSDQEISFKYQDISQGHNIQAWVNYLDEILQMFYPNKGT